MEEKLLVKGVWSLYEYLSRPEDSSPLFRLYPTGATSQRAQKTKRELLKDANDSNGSRYAKSCHYQRHTNVTEA